MSMPAGPQQHPALASDAGYRIVSEGATAILTPALAIYPEVVDANIAETLRLLGSDANRWRPHVKTAKLAFTMRRLVKHGIRQCKCATTLELTTACDAGFDDVLLAYGVVGPHVTRVLEIAAQRSGVRVSALVESPAQIGVWEGSRVGLFVDVNPGMNRTGLGQERTDDLVALARAILGAGLEFRGLHYYDGQMAGVPVEEREAAAHHGYDQLLRLVAALRDAGISVPEVVTAGTPAFPASLSYAPFRDAPFAHRVSPGTVVYADVTSLAQLPAEYRYQPAALVVATVVSHPTPERITCDAGHKAVSADMGDPTCAVLARLDLRPLHPSEEHLPIEVAAGPPVPAIGDTLYLVPRHICPTVNNFDAALIVVGGRIVGVERVTARGHEGPLLGSQA